jgi:hypothetical protein
MGVDRRQAARYDVSIDLNVRFLPDGSPIKASAIEVGPNGMRILTAIPLVEASYVHISFASASNNTFCEGRVVWTQRSTDNSTQFESGVDIQRWGGGLPGEEVINSLTDIKPKKDRRSRRR